VATFVKTKAARWKAIIRRKGWDTASKTFRTKRDAQDWARSTEDEMVRGVYINRAPSERTTINEALQRYLQEVTPTKKPTTQRAEIKKAKLLFDRLGKHSLAALTPEVVAKFRDQRLKEGKSNNTVRLELALLSHLYTVAIQEWGIGLVYNPVSTIRKPSAGQGRNRRLSREEEKRLLKVCSEHSNPYLSWIVQIALYTGMRKGEIMSLRRNQVDVTRRIVKLDETKNGTSRIVPLIKAAQRAFTEAINHPIRPIDTDLLFPGAPGRDGKRRPYEMSPAWYTVKKKAELEDLHFHDLRHEAVSRLVEAGLGDQEVAAISGHKTMQMLKRYTHLRAEDLVSKLDKLLEG